MMMLLLEERRRGRGGHCWDLRRGMQERQDRGGLHEVLITLRQSPSQALTRFIIIAFLFFLLFFEGWHRSRFLRGGEQGEQEAVLLRGGNTAICENGEGVMRLRRFAMSWEGHHRPLSVCCFFFLLFKRRRCFLCLLLSSSSSTRSRKRRGFCCRE